MKMPNFGKQFFAALALTLTLVMFSACSSTEEAPPADTSGGSGGGSCEDCGKYTGDVDIKECEVRNDMKEGC
jgi:hypothetical protein